ncbi:FAD/NAD(P)-binding oxidoreductase [Acrocarpospora macrocephala]|uniref:Ferredoxin reductase n=1 Tax=Acrocarpospora macrocephala TaxID=150177 RepID=A0A5M3WJF7_9ACTN|nr:FAD-dependent oxidoreductase [Acrocarpospora macrocephala]GES07173.1 ferredoxin reductase [Acrocarpospora macrocephala]
MRSVVIAGGAIAGLSAARELRRAGFPGRIQVVDQDRRGPYRRPEVSKGLLEGRLGLDSVATPWPADLNVDRILGVRLTGLDLAARTVQVEGGAVPFDGLVIATGCAARRSPYEAMAGVHTLRSADDAERMRPELAAAMKIVIVGAGFIGLEVASVARKLGKSVTLLEAAEIPLARVLGDDFGEHIAGTHRAHGVDLRTGVTVAGVTAGASGRVSSVELTSGETVAADVVLVAIGSEPATGWLRDSGLDLSMGVVCDETCAVADGVVAAGDVASWINPLYRRRMRVEHWTNAVEQGAYAARRLMGTHDPTGFASVPYFWSDQYGVKLQCVGSTLDHDQYAVLDDSDGRFLVAYGRAGRLVCVAGMNAGAAVMKHRALVLRAVPLAEVAAASRT